MNLGRPLGSGLPRPEGGGGGSVWWWLKREQPSAQSDRLERAIYRCCRNELQENEGTVYSGLMQGF